MICDYNGNLEYEERIAKVVKEIQDNYNFITKGEAILVASLEPIINDFNNDISLAKRLYYIMRVNHNYDNIIYKDILNINSNNDIIISFKIAIEEYIKGNRKFPEYNEIFTD